MRKRAERSGYSRKYRLEARGKKFKVWAVRIGTRGSGESTTEMERERVSGAGMNMPEKHFPGKQSGTKSLEIIEMEGDTGGCSQTQTLKRCRRVGLRTQCRSVELTFKRSTE